MVTKDKAIEELILDAQPADPEIKTGVVGSAGEDGTANVTITEVLGVEHVYVWDRFTGERSKILKSSLPTQLKKLDAQGRRVFTTVKPAIEPVRGDKVCMLHASHPDRPLHDRMGFPVCTKANLRTSLDVRTHMQHRHQREWAALEDERKGQTEREEREVRKAIIAQQSEIALERATRPGVRKDS